MQKIVQISYELRITTNWKDGIYKSTVIPNPPEASEGDEESLHSNNELTGRDSSANNASE